MHGSGRPPLSLGDALRTSLRTFGENLFVLLLLAALFHVPPTLVAHVVSGPVAWVTRFLFGLAFQAIVTHAVFQSLRGRPVGWGDSVRKGLGRLGVASGAALAVGLGVAAPAVALAFVGTGVGVVLGGPPVPVALLSALPVLAWVLWAMSAWFVAVQCAVVEGRPANSGSRSAYLTRGHRGKVLAIVLLLHAVPGLLALGLDRVLFDPRDRFFHRQALFLALETFDALFWPLQAVTAAVVYHGLRRVKEGADTALLLRVFE